jgi:shikimate dehydrogenase
VTGGRCAVLGSPIAHSLSPALHRAAYDALGLDWTYEAFEVTEQELPGFLSGMRSGIRSGLDSPWRGLSLTMPLKRAVLSLLDEVSERSRQAGAANTVVPVGGRLVGHNTDVPGVTAALHERLETAPSSAVVLGGGATAASALLGLADLGCRDVTLVVRDHTRAAETVAAAARHPRGPRLVVRSFGVSPIDADVLVSTIPAVAQDDGVLAWAEGCSAVFDVVYDPWPTPLATAAQQSGRLLVTGLDLLVHQAVRQVELMTGAAPAPLDVMRVAGDRALAARDAG